MSKADFFNKKAGGFRIIVVPQPTPTPELPDGTFGSGSGGNLVYAAHTTLTNDIEANNITVNNGIILTLGWNAAENRPVRLKANGTLTLIGSAAISANGTNNPGSTASGVPRDAAANGYPGGNGGNGGGAGGNSATESGGTPTPGVSVTNSIGGNGGAGYGPGPNHEAGSAGGVASVVTLSNINDLITASYGGSPLKGGAGGGAGGWNTGGRPGIGGGGGGGIAHVLARHIAVSGTPTSQIRANGGGGGGSTATHGRAASGGGGGGGVIVVCETIDPRVTLSAAGGAFGDTFGNIDGQPGLYGSVYLAASDPYVNVVYGRLYPVTVTF